MKNKTIAIIILIGIFSISCILSMVRILLVPSARTGPFGIGLPSDLTTFGDQSKKFTIDYPDSWIFYETPEGNHGDKEVIATINVPGRSWPSVKIAMLSSRSEDVNQVVEYGKQKTSDLPGLSEISLSRFTSSHYDGLLREYSWVSDSLLGRTSVLCEDYYLNGKYRGYFVTFCAEKKHWPIVQDVFWQIMDSFILN